MKAHVPPFLSVKPALLTTALLATFTMGAASAQAATEMPSGEHASADVDITQPIKAIDKLESLKNEQKLSLSIPKFQHFTTSNGVPVIFVQTKQLPIVDVDLRFNAGSARDESIRKQGFGLASMVADLLTKGTKDLDETAFAEATEQLGIELSSAAYKDQFVVNLRSLSDAEHLDPALSLMSSIITQPRFDAQVLERSKAQQVLALKQMMQNPPI
nr:insulinase family protein [Psychrobacter sp. PraFG1]UNK04870.1 insulinase family protein [Psychrobacter sp. PraFG1]